MPLPPTQSSRAADRRAIRFAKLARHTEAAIARGDLAAATHACRQLVAEFPRTAAAWRQLGLLALRSNDFRSAVESLSRAVELDRDDVESVIDLGCALHAAGRPVESLQVLEQVIQRAPENIRAWLAIGEILLAVGELDSASDCLYQVLALDAENITAQLQLARLASLRGDVAAEEQQYRGVLVSDPGNEIAGVNLANLLSRRGDSAAAVALLRRALADHPHSTAVRYALGNAVGEVGEFEEAKSLLSSVLTGHARPARVFFNFVNLQRIEVRDEPAIRGWREIAESRCGDDDDRAHLEFALGKIADDLGRFDEAFGHFERGNNLAGVTFDAAAHERRIDDIIATWTPAQFSGEIAAATGGARPVFIVGMPRSGTTLVEQLLARHAQVLPRGELTALPETLSTARARLTVDSERELLARLTPQIAQELAQSYVREASPGPAAKVFSDKLPANFLQLGWIARLFPQAIIVHCVRDPRDVCLSCYFQHFTRRLAYAYRLEDLVAYYRSYERIMSHWRGVLPSTIHEVRYEDLVADPLTGSQQLATACGLPWETEPALRGESRAIQTASVWQARQPVHTRSRQRWRNYESHIGVLLAAFGDRTDE